MENLLAEIVTAQIYAFIMIFCRVGAAVMIMPGIGDSFVSSRVRLLFALAFSLVITPFLTEQIPAIPVGGPAFFLLILMEVLTGVFIGTIARIFMAALDVAGMIISLHMGLAAAQMFNPSAAMQGSLVGAFLSITGAVLLFVTNMHHLLIMAIVDSYQVFEPGREMMLGGMASMVASSLSSAFLIGFQFAMPFMITGFMIYIGMGLMARLMPQIQVFILALPMQIMVGMFSMMIVLPAGFLFWLTSYEDNIIKFLETLN